MEHLPENVHLVISSRTHPPLPLGRLRARGELNEIRTEQLAFSEEEAACLLNEKMGLDIGTDDLSVLFERTEGWPAAIYLAYLSLQKREDKHAFIASFGGSNRIHRRPPGRGRSRGPVRGSESVSAEDLGAEEDDRPSLRRGGG